MDYWYLIKIEIFTSVSGVCFTLSRADAHVESYIGDLWIKQMETQGLGS